MYAKLRSALSRLGGTDAIVTQNIVDVELAQGPYVAARVGIETETLRTTGTEPHHRATTPPRKSQSHRKYDISSWEHIAMTLLIRES